MPIANIITGELGILVRNEFLIYCFLKPSSIFISTKTFAGQLKDEIITCSLVAEDVLRKWDMESPLVRIILFLFKGIL